MRRFALLLCVVLLATVLTATVSAQAPGTTLPTVVTFTADLPGITVVDAEAGVTPVTLAWTTVNMAPGQTVALDAYVLQNWVSLVTSGETLEASGQRTIMVEHPLNFGTPTYRLSILGADGATIDQRVLSIPYIVAADAVPTVAAFTSSAADVAPGENGVAIVPVAWQVTNRLPSSYLKFEQVLPDGQIVAIDLPRTTLWVASSGEGAVAPTIPAGASTVTLLLRVVDAATEQTYATAELTLPVAGMAPPAPPVVTTPDVTPPEATEAAPVNPADVGIFYFQPTFTGAAPDTQFALVWDVGGAPAVQISYNDLSGTPVVRSGLKPSGDLIIALAEVGFAPEAGRYQFTLTATDANGVALNDPSGLPISQVVEIAAESPISINSFATDATTITPGQPIGLSWDVAGATSVTLSRLSVQDNQLVSDVLGEALPAAGAQQFTLPEGGETGDHVTFLLMAEDGTSASRAAYLRVPLPAPPPTSTEEPAPASDLSIDLFSVEPTDVNPGGAVSIAWETTGATRVWLSQSSPETGMTATIADNLPAAGSLQIAVPAEIAAEDLPLATGFVIQAENASGETVRQDVLVTIVAP
jgi:hypothetical protein